MAMKTTTSKQNPIRTEFVLSAARLPAPPARGRVVLADVAFAFDEDFAKVTEPYLEALGDRLAGFIDHHDHPAWPEFADDPRFVLVPKAQAPACPQIVTPELCAWLGPFEVVVAHADFDGCLTAVKLLRAGLPAYPEADEDARAIDDPGRGFSCSPAGLRLDRAMDQARIDDPRGYLALLGEIAAALVAEREPRSLAERLDELAQARQDQEVGLARLLTGAVRPHPEVILLRLERAVAGPDKKWLLRELEQRARVAVLAEGGWTTVASYQVAGAHGLDLGAIEGLKGSVSYAWGQRDADWLVAQVVALLESALG